MARFATFEDWWQTVAPFYPEVPDEEPAGFVRRAPKSRRHHTRGRAVRTYPVEQPVRPVSRGVNPLHSHVLVEGAGAGDLNFVVPRCH